MRLFRKKTAPAQPRRIPTHIAIVMDGNGRWAKQRGLPRPAGHKAGAESFRTIANYAKSIGLQYLTVYAFSTENWKRPEGEVDAIMDLLEKYLREAIRDMDRNRVRFCFFGDLSRLSPELRREAQEAVERSKKYEGVQVNFCLNYGGRDEIVRAAQRFAAQCAAGERRPEELTEDMFSDLLYSAGVPDPELVIRPGRDSHFQFSVMAVGLCRILFYGCPLAGLRPGGAGQSDRRLQRARSPLWRSEIIC